MDITTLYLGERSEASMALMRQTIFLAQSSESSMLAVRITSSTLTDSADLRESKIKRVIRLY